MVALIGCHWPSVYTCGLLVGATVGAAAFGGRAVNARSDGAPGVDALDIAWQSSTAGLVADRRLSTCR